MQRRQVGRAPRQAQEPRLVRAGRRRGGRSGSGVLAISGSRDGGLTSASRRYVTSREPPRVARLASTSCSSLTSRATTLSRQSVSPATLSAARICGSARISSSKMRDERRSCLASVAATYTCSGKPTAAGSSWALMILITPDSFSRRPRDPGQGVRGGQPGQPGQLDVGPVCILLQRSEQCYINFVKLNRHKTK